MMRKNFLIFTLLFFSGSLSNKLKAGYYQNIQPRNDNEYYLYGGGLGSASTLCELLVSNEISFTTEKTFKKPSSWKPLENPPAPENKSM